MIERTELAPGYSISRVVNGLWQLSRGHRSGEVDHGGAVESLRKLVDAGLTTFDCADIYLGVEEVLGALIEQLRTVGIGDDRVQIHTKYVPDRETLGEIDRASVARAIEGSLSRLGIEALDLVQLHWWDYGIPRYVDVAGWLSELRTEGKIRHLGTTNFDLTRLRELIEAGIPLVSNQTQLSLLDRRVEESMAAYCEEHSIGLLCYGALGGGLLTERYRQTPKPVAPYENRSIQKYKLIVDEFGGWPLHQQLLATLAAVAEKHSVSIATVASRWVLDRSAVAAVMIGTRSTDHLDDTLDVFTVELDDHDRSSIAEILEQATGPAGEPYELERRLDSPHAKIMWTDLNRERAD